MDRQSKTLFAVFLLVASTFFLIGNIVNRDPIEEWLIAGVLFALSMVFWLWLWLDMQADAEVPTTAITPTIEPEVTPKAQEWIITKEMVDGLRQEAAVMVNTRVTEKPMAEEAVPDEMTTLEERGIDLDTIPELDHAPQGTPALPDDQGETSPAESTAPVEVEAPAIKSEEEALPVVSKIDAKPDAEDLPEHKPEDEFPAEQVLDPDRAAADTAADARDGIVEEKTPASEEDLKIIEESDAGEVVAHQPEDPNTPVEEEPEPLPVESPLQKGVNDAETQVDLVETGDPKRENAGEREIVLEDSPALHDTPAPDPNEAHDLTLVEGIGPKYQEALHAAGITTFGQLAELSLERIEQIARDHGMRRSASMSTWAEQAALAAAGDWQGLSILKKSLIGGRRDDDQILG